MGMVGIVSFLNELHGFNHIDTLCHIYLVCLFTKVCSKEPNISKLLEKYDAQIVSTESSLACIIDNHGPMFERQWEMPVVVKNVSFQGRFLHSVRNFN